MAFQLAMRREWWELVWQKMYVDCLVVQHLMAGCVKNRQEICWGSKIPQRTLFRTSCLIYSSFSFFAFQITCAKCMKNSFCCCFHGLIMLYTTEMSNLRWITTGCVAWKDGGTYHSSGLRHKSSFCCVFHCQRKPKCIRHGCSPGCPESRIGSIVVMVHIFFNF